ncbi:hypothetical protein VPH35_072211 [Triticum aestivum]
MNLYYSGDAFLPTIIAVIYNFKPLFAATYGNTTFSIGNFESRFLPALKVNFRYDSRVFLLHILATTEVLEWRVSLMMIYKVYMRNCFSRLSLARTMKFSCHL